MNTNKLKIIKKIILEKLSLPTKNIQTVNFIILKSKKRQRNAGHHGRHFDKVEAKGDTPNPKMKKLASVV